MKEKFFIKNFNRIEKLDSKAPAYFLKIYFKFTSYIQNNISYNVCVYISYIYTYIMHPL